MAGMHGLQRICLAAASYSLKHKTIFIAYCLAVSPELQVVSIVFSVFAYFPFAASFFPGDFGAKGEMSSYVVDAPAFVGAEHEGAVWNLFFEIFEIRVAGFQNNVDHANDG